MIESLDYEAVGFMSGLEVHQQLMTEHKLFCRCPAGLYTEDHDGEVLRHMRPTLSELGEYDGTVLMEFKTKKEIIYLLNHLNVCTYEMDDTPPFLVNQQAIDVAIELCLMMNMDIIDEVHVDDRISEPLRRLGLPTAYLRNADDLIAESLRLPATDRTLRSRERGTEKARVRVTTSTRRTTSPEDAPADVRVTALTCSVVVWSSHQRHVLGFAAA